MTEPDPLEDADQLHQLASAVLTHAAALLEANEYDVPERRFVAPGRVTTMPGCETLAVVVTRVHAGEPGAETRVTTPGCLLPTTAVIQVVLHRCVPTIDNDGAPSTEAVAAAGQDLVEQGWVLLRGFQGVLGQRPAAGRLVGVAGPLEAIRPDGGVGGWQLTITARV